MWKRLVRIVSMGVQACSPFELRSDTIQVLHTTCAYPEYDFFGELDQCPFKVTQGDIPANINVVAYLPLGEVTLLDPLSLEIRQCIDVGMTRTHRGCCGICS